jgi:hypothetical protein
LRIGRLPFGIASLGFYTAAPEHPMNRHLYVMAVLLASPLAAEGEPGLWSNFNWGIHSITIPFVFLAGLIAGWLLRERKAAEERAREEIAKQKGEPKQG